MDDLLSRITRIKNRSGAWLVFHVCEGGTESGNTAMIEVIDPDAHIDVCYNDIYSSKSRKGKGPIASYVHVEGSHRSLWLTIDAAQIRKNAVLVLGFDEEANRISVKAVKGNYMERLRMFVGLKNAMKMIEDKLPGKKKRLKNC